MLLFAAIFSLKTDPSAASKCVYTSSTAGVPQTKLTKDSSPRISNRFFTAPCLRCKALSLPSFLNNPISPRINPSICASVVQSLVSGKNLSHINLNHNSLNYPTIFNTVERQFAQCLRTSALLPSQHYSKTSMNTSSSSLARTPRFLACTNSTEWRSTGTMRRILPRFAHGQPTSRSSTCCR